jgi:Tol biopolymer transport system component
MCKGILLLTVLTVAAMAFAAAPLAHAGTTEIVSVDSYGNQANDISGWWPCVSADGKYVAFSSWASNLVLGDTNYTLDVFVHARETGTTERVSVDSSGNQANRGSVGCSISADGRYVAFTSQASNLVPGDTNGMSDVFVHDRETGTTELVSVDSSGNQANGGSSGPFISADGRYVAFSSWASNLVPGDTNGISDAFVHDRQTGTTEIASVDSYGNHGNGISIGLSISADGRYVAFMSYASNLVPGDTNGMSDVFVHDRETGTTERVSVDSSGNQADDWSEGSSISADGRYVAFRSGASNLVPGDTSRFRPDIFIHDRQTGVTERVSIGRYGNQGNGGSSGPFISADGKVVAFTSEASNLVPNDTNGLMDVFVRDRDAAPAIPDTIADTTAVVEVLLTSGDIASPGTATSLNATLDSALQAQDNGNVYAARNTLLAFINQVQAQSGKKISEDAASLLIAAANQIIETLQ